MPNLTSTRCWRELEAISLDDVRAYYEATVLRAPALLSGAGGLDAGAFERMAGSALGSLHFTSILAPQPVPVVRASRGTRCARQR